MTDLTELENKIINADCMDILKQLPDKCIDLVLTDPPYGIKCDEGGMASGYALQNTKKRIGTMKFRQKKFLMRFSEFQKIKLFVVEIISRHICNRQKVGEYGIK